MREYLVIQEVPNGCVLHFEAENKREALKALNEGYDVQYRFTRDRLKSEWLLVEKADWYHYRFSKVSHIASKP